MKANKKFVEEKEAVSAVIGVILMVAITVAIAATVYVYVSGMLGPQTDETESASVTIEGKKGYIRLTLTKVGDNYPTAGYATTDCAIFVDGTKITPANAWESGMPIYIEATAAGGSTPQEATGTPGAVNLTAASYDVSVSIKGTAVGTGTAIVTDP